jgi:Putative lumazine-binding
MALKGPSEAVAAAAPDYDDIARVVQLYIDGFNDRDVNKFKEAFHDDAWIFFTAADGGLTQHLIADLHEQWASGGYPNEDVVGRLLSVTQAGDVASALLVWDHHDDDPANRWVDIHALLRIDGVWKITNKTATHYSRAALGG